MWQRVRKGAKIPRSGIIRHPGDVMINRREFLRSLATSAAAAGVARAGAGDGAATAATQSASSGATAGSSVPALAGKIHFKGDAQYEALRQAATWNARKPSRFPNAIVLAEREDDVIAAVKLARERGWQVTTRSGGHSWSGSHTRDNT